MKRMRLISLKALVSALVIVASGASVARAADDATAAIEKANKAFIEAVHRGDTAALARMYTSNAKAMPPNAEAVSGRDEIGALWSSVIASGVTGLQLNTIEVETHGDTAIEVGTLQALGKDAAPIARGKYMVLWKREGGAWKLHRDIWNMDAAPEPPVKPSNTK